MRIPLCEDSHIMVVLYREGWGKTRWTAIEELAIKDACFNGDWERLFFVSHDGKSRLPGWLPPHYVRYNWEEFGAEQVVGIIKSRVLERGGLLLPVTPLKMAERFSADEGFGLDKAQMWSSHAGNDDEHRSTAPIRTPYGHRKRLRR